MPSPLIQPMIDEFTRESATTRTLLAASPTEKLDWQPHEKSMTLGALNRHIAMVPKHLCDFLTNDTFDFANANTPPLGAETTEAILDAFDESLSHAQNTLAEYDDAFASANWSAVFNGKQVIAAPRFAAVRSFILNHIYHHRGQLSVYLRLLNVPVPSVYGPTADINPFA